MNITLSTDYGRTEEERLKFFSKLSYGKVLDIGCAKLPNTFLKENNRVEEIYGLDLEKIDHPIYKEFKQADLDEGIPYSPNSFDIVIAGEIIEHVKNPYGLLLNIRNVLKDEGILILSTPNPYYYVEIIRKLMGVSAPEDAEHIFLIDKYQLRRILINTKFDILAIKSYKFWIPIIKLSIISFNLPSIFTYQHIFVAKKLRN